MPAFKKYLIGFMLSVALTLAAFALVAIHINSGHTVFSHTFLIYSVIILALCQLVVQMIFFLHLNTGDNSRWNWVIFSSTVIIILILVIGSIWIMNHLNYNMTPGQMNKYMDSQDGI